MAEMMRWVLVVVTFASCAQPAAPGSEHCLPGVLSACVCDDGKSGAHRCAADGVSYAACECGAPGLSQSPRATAPSVSTSTRAAGTTVANSGGSAVPPVSARPAVAIPASAGVVPEPNDEASYVFDQTVVRTYNIIVAEADLKKIGLQPSAEMFVPAMLEFEGKTLGPFNVRYKGNSWGAPCTTGGRDDPKDGKCSMKLDFDAHDPKARFYALKKLNFHSMNNDPSLLRDRLGYALFREMGIAAPRSAHARLLVNGKLEGIFIVVEPIDGVFTRSHFTDGGKGNLYKEVWPVSPEDSVYLEKLVTNEKEQPSVMGMLAFKQAVDRGPDAVRSLIDREYFLRYLAVDRLIINDDGALHFWCDGPPATVGHNGNYYWYEAPSHDKFWLVPWDLDESFDGYPPGRISPEWTTTAACSCVGSGSLFSMPSACDKLTQSFISWLPDYQTQVDAFLAGPYAASAVDVKLATWSQQIAPVVEETAGKNAAPSADEWRAGVNQLKATIASSRQHRGLAR